LFDLGNPDYASQRSSPNVGHRCRAAWFAELSILDFLCQLDDTDHHRRAREGL
jgi:hypothetical protein